jgi:arsenate reductase
MAEGWARHLKADLYNALSAGTDPHGVNPMAVKVMEEVGVDLSQHSSKTIEDVKDVALDLVISVCDSARESCPALSGGIKHIHSGFDDPPALARDCTTEEEALEHYRRVRDEIREYIETTPEVFRF